MTDKLHCPFCGVELLGSLNEKYCTNRECEHYMRTIPTSIWQALIDGKKAQRQLKTVKDRCVKKIKAKEREIASYLNGISVRQSENEKLAKQLKQAQDALNRAISEISELCFTVLYCSGEADNELELVRQHTEMVEEAKARIFSEITSITKQEE